jgi:hypothetical protein
VFYQTELRALSKRKSFSTSNVSHKGDITGICGYYTFSVRCGWGTRCEEAMGTALSDTTTVSSLNGTCLPGRGPWMENMDGFWLSRSRGGEPNARFRHQFRSCYYRSWFGVGPANEVLENFEGNIAWNCPVSTGFGPGTQMDSESGHGANGVDWTFPPVPDAFYWSRSSALHCSEKRMSPSERGKMSSLLPGSQVEIGWGSMRYRRRMRHTICWLVLTFQAFFFCFVYGC